MHERGYVIGFVHLSSSSVIQKFWKTLSTGNSEVTTISKLKDNTEVRGTLAYMYVIK